MTSEQQQMVLDSEWVVNTVLKKLNMCSKDYKQTAMLFVCQAVEKYDANKNAKWTTFVYKDLTFRMKRYHREMVLSDQYSVFDFNEMVKKVPESVTRDLECEDFDVNLVKKAIHTLTKDELLVLKYREAGYKLREISSATGFSISKLIKLIASIKKKARNIYEKEPN